MTIFTAPRIQQNRYNDNSSKLSEVHDVFQAACRWAQVYGEKVCYVDEFGDRLIVNEDGSMKAA